VRILAVDPGPTTGFCLYHLKSHTVVDVWNESLGTKQPHMHLWNVIETISFDMMLLERFEHRPNQQAVDIRAAEYVGVCKLCMQQNDYLPLHMVSASTIGRTSFWADDNKRVKQIGLYNSKAAPHGMDALRHILYYVTFTLKDNYWLEKLK
jgi:hypothetical protein